MSDFRNSSPSGESAGASCALRLSAFMPEQPLQCAFRPVRPLLLWDGQCAFCARWAARLHRLAAGRLDCAPYHQRAEDFPEIPRESFEQAVFLILPDGGAYHSAQAVYRALALRPPLGVALWLYRKIPPFARFSDRRYRAIASRRRCRL